MQQKHGLSTSEYCVRRIPCKFNIRGGCFSSTSNLLSNGLPGRSAPFGLPEYTYNAAVSSAGRAMYSSVFGRCGGTWPRGRRSQQHGRMENMQFWRQQQQLPCKQRVTHASRFNPEADVERAIEAIAGTNWGEVAQNRGRWQDLSAIFVQNIFSRASLEKFRRRVTPDMSRRCADSRGEGAWTLPFFLTS